jgi:hypothetical protein
MNVTDAIPGYHSSDGARLCGQDLRGRYPSISAIPVLLSLSNRLLVCEEAPGCMAVLSLRYAWEASAVVVYGNVRSIVLGHLWYFPLRVESYHMHAIPTLIIAPII